MSKLTKLPPQILNELQEQIRANYYGNLYFLYDWLKEKGYHISKSALHRHITNLKQLDGYTAKSGTLELLAQISTETKDSFNLSELYKQLGRLEAEKQKIIKKITAILETHEA